MERISVLRRVTTSPGGTSLTYTVDRVTVEAIPEPATLGIFVLAGLGLLARRRLK